MSAGVFPCDGGLSPGHCRRVHHSWQPIVFGKRSLTTMISTREPKRLVMVMVVVATLTRPTASCPLSQEERCAEDSVSGVEEREKGGRESWGRMRESVCVWSGEARKREMCVRTGVQSIKDIEPAIHQMTCAVLPQYLFDLSLINKGLRRTKHHKTHCQKTTVSLVIHEQTHLDKSIFVSG